MTKNTEDLRVYRSLRLPLLLLMLVLMVIGVVGAILVNHYF